MGVAYLKISWRKPSWVAVTIQYSRVLYRIFHQRGEIIACGNILKLGGSGGMLPQENFEF